MTDDVVVRARLYISVKIRDLQMVLAEHGVTEVAICHGRNASGEFSFIEAELGLLTLEAVLQAYKGNALQTVRVMPKPVLDHATTVPELGAALRGRAYRSEGFEVEFLLRTKEGLVTDDSYRQMLFKKLDMKIANCGLTVRASYALVEHSNGRGRYSSIGYVGQLVVETLDSLGNRNNMGRKTIGQIQTYLEKQGLQVGMTPQELMGWKPPEEREQEAGA